MKRKFLCLLLCLVTVLSVFPFTVSAENSEISVVNLSGAKNALSAEMVEDYKNAVSISNNGDKRYYVKYVNCYEAYDRSMMYGKDKFFPGVDYCLKITLYPNEGFTFPYDVSNITVTMDGSPVKAENIKTYVSSSQKNARYAEITIPFTTPGKRVDYITDLYFTVKETPYMGATPSLGTSLCSIPDSLPYRVNTACWRYITGNGGWSASKDFTESEKYELWLSIVAKDGENIRFSDLAHTALHVSGNSSYTDVRISRTGDGECRVYLSYNNEYPPTYNVKYDPCGGSFPDGGTAIATGRTRVDGTVSHLWSEMTKSGYSFMGWFTAPEGGEKVTTGTKFSGPTTLYAQWTPCIDKVYIENVMLPLAGKAPVFTAKVPDGAGYKIISERWTEVSEGREKIASSSIAENKILEEYSKETGEEMAIRVFDGSKVYSYELELQSENGVPFGKNTTVYLNGQSSQVYCSSDTLYFSNTYDCASPKEFEVFDGAKIEQGICSSVIKTLDLNNYVRSKTSCTFTASSKPSWISLSADGKITGIRPASVQAGTSFTVKVSDGSTAKTMTVSVGEVTEEWAISVNPEPQYLRDCLSFGVFFVDTTASNPTYSWEIMVPGNSNWYPLSTIAPMLDLDFESRYGVMTIAPSEGNPTDLSGCYFRCKVTADGKTKTSKGVRLTVSHYYTECAPTASNEAATHTYTCELCKATKKENHIFSYTLVKEATAGEYGTYRETCAVCDKSLNHSYKTPASSSNIVVTLDFNGADAPTGSANRLHKQFSNAVPYQYYPIRDGYVFCGWSILKGSDKVAYAPDEKVFMETNMTLYAVWRPMEIVVNGIPVTQENMSDILGDGSVYLMAPTNKHVPVLVLNGAKLQSKYLPSIETYAAIYSANPIEIMTSGSGNTITVSGDSSVGICCDETVLLSGTDLTIKGVSAYKTAIEAKSADIGLGNLLIKDAKYGIDGNAEFYNGFTRITADSYSGTDHRAVTGKATLYSYYQADVSAASTDGAKYVPTVLANAVRLRNMKIEPQGAEKPVAIKVGDAKIDVTAPFVGRKPNTFVPAEDDRYYSVIEGWYKKSAKSSSFPGTALENDETFTDDAGLVYVAKIRLSPKDGYEFVSAGEIEAIVNDIPAAKIEQDGDDIIVMAQFNCIVVSGAGWYIDNTGCLYFTGAVSNTSYGGDETPWKNYKSLIKTAVAQKGSSIGNYNRMFRNCENLVSVDLKNLELSYYKDCSMECMFADCPKLKTVDLSGLDTSRVDSMYYMFNNCTSLSSVNFGNIDTSQVTTMSYMFENCRMLMTVDMSDLSVAKLGIATSIFDGCSLLYEVTGPGKFLSRAADSLLSIYPEWISNAGTIYTVKKDFSVYGSGNITVARNGYDPVKIGDINGDGKVNAVDTNLMKQILTNTITPTSIQFASADINGDGKVNAVDSNLLKRMILGG